jgi:MraZ protein
MLLGEFRCVADDSGRLNIPAELCPELAEGLALTRGIERCLFAFPAEEWQELAEKMRAQLPLTSRDARAFTRLMFAGALTCVPDQRGQIPLPGDLREYAGIEEEAVVVGLCTHLEIWSPQRWQEVRARMVEEGTAVAERLSQCGV